MSSNVITTVSDFEDVLDEDRLAVPAPVNQLIGLRIEKKDADLA